MQVPLERLRALGEGTGHDVHEMYCMKPTIPISQLILGLDHSSMFDD